MNCVESRELMPAHGDDELDVANSLQLERHLKTCSACTAEREAAKALKTALQQPSLRYKAPDSLQRELRRAIRAASSATSPSLFHSLLFWKSLAFGAAAFALLAILLRPGVVGRDPFLVEAVSSHVRSLMAEHLTDVASSDQHTVKPWFNGKLDFAPKVKDFAAQGFPLLGGRLDYLDGHPVAALVYGRHKHIINVFVRPESKKTSRKSVVQHLRGYSVINLDSEGLHYCVVSDLNQQELSEFAGLLER